MFWILKLDWDIMWYFYLLSWITMMLGGAILTDSPPPLPIFFGKILKIFFQKKLFFKNYEKLFYPFGPSGHSRNIIRHIPDTFWKNIKKNFRKKFLGGGGGEYLRVASLSGNLCEVTLAKRPGRIGKTAQVF